MKIRIVVDDKIVSIDRTVIEMPELDWSKFDGDPSSPWDDIAAVQFDTERGQGHIEYRDVMTAQATRDNMRPPDWKINQAQFEAMFGWVISLHAARKAEMEAERAKAEEEAAKVRQDAEAAFLAQQQADLERQGEAVVAPAAGSEDLRAEMDELRAKNADLAAKVNAMLQAAKDVGGEVA